MILWSIQLSIWEIAEDDYYGFQTDNPDLDDFIDNSDERNAVNTYDHYIGAEVQIPDSKGQKFMAKVIKKVKSADENISSSSSSSSSAMSRSILNSTSGALEDATSVLWESLHHTNNTLDKMCTPTVKITHTKAVMSPQLWTTQEGSEAVGVVLHKPCRLL